MLGFFRFLGFMLQTALIWGLYFIAALILGYSSDVSSARLLAGFICSCGFYYLWLHIMVSPRRERQWKIPLLILFAVLTFAMYEYNLMAVLALIPCVLMPVVLHYLSLYCLKKDPFMVWLFNYMREMQGILWGGMSVLCFDSLHSTAAALSNLFGDRLTFFLLTNVFVLLSGLIYRSKLFEATPQAVCTLVNLDAFFDPPVFSRYGLFRVHALWEMLTISDLMQHRPNNTILPLPPSLFLMYQDIGRMFNCHAALTLQLDASYFSASQNEQTHHDFVKFIDDRKELCSISVFIKRAVETELYDEMMASLSQMEINIIDAADVDDHEEHDDFVLKLALLQAQSHRRITALLLEMRSIMPDHDKYRFPKLLLERLSENAIDSVDVFFQMIKLSEYMVHYRALCSLAHDRQNTPIVELLNPAFGTWNNCQRDNWWLSDPEAAVESMHFIAGKTVRGKVGRLAGDWRSACAVLVNLRNRYVGHGTLTYSVSEQLLFHLCRLVLLMVKDFVVQDETLSSADVFLPVRGHTVPCTLQGGLYLYSSADQVGENFNAEYFDYATGDYQKLIKEQYVWKLLRWEDWSK